ncbi:cysteine-rich CWC family protein [Polaromonas sp.]|uniref:cysteine-rich CWC family protein n=1 Tax=Polaromonas sp. TaxID=1869339 RepID=UPI001D3EA2A5|nr:cysteine-rich CWC family protein [Polaromonas sp.]MBT9476809.1 cysteine-rich CWC family protein [Polaromonas sp.]
MTANTADRPNTSRCPRCGAGLRCGMVAGDAECWCTQLPLVMPVPPSTPAGSAASCYCPACLTHITNDRLRASTLPPATAPD